MKTKTILTNNLCENNIDSLYVKLCKLLEDNGQHIVSRGMAVKELIGVSISSNGAQKTIFRELC